MDKSFVFSDSRRSNYVATNYITLIDLLNELLCQTAHEQRTLMTLGRSDVDKINVIINIVSATKQSNDDANTVRRSLSVEAFISLINNCYQYIRYTSRQRNGAIYWSRTFYLSPIDRSFINFPQLQCEPFVPTPETPLAFHRPIPCRRTT